MAIPNDSTPAGELSGLKRYLKTESARLQEWHRDGGGGREVCLGRSRMIDTLLRTLCEGTLARLKLPGNARKLKVSLVAIGGYGREELSPHSDLSLIHI